MSGGTRVTGPCRQAQYFRAEKTHHIVWMWTNSDPVCIAVIEIPCIQLLSVFFPNGKSDPVCNGLKMLADRKTDKVLWNELMDKKNIVMQSWTGNVGQKRPGLNIKSWEPSCEMNPLWILGGTCLAVRRVHALSPLLSTSSDPAAR